MEGQVNKSDQDNKLPKDKFISTIKFVLSSILFLIM